MSLEFPQLFIVATEGFTSVQAPVEVFAPLLQYLLAFSHSTTPLQLSVNVLSRMSMPTP